MQKNEGKSRKYESRLLVYRQQMSIDITVHNEMDGTGVQTPQCIMAQMVLTSKTAPRTHALNLSKKHTKIELCSTDSIEIG